jgi:hypothetical protein
MLTHAGLARMLEISRNDTQFGVKVFCGLRNSIDNRKYDACASPASKMGTEVVGTLTHADTPQWGNAAQRPASRMRISRFTINTHMELCFAGATHAYLIAKIPEYFTTTNSDIILINPISEDNLCRCYREIYSRHLPFVNDR